jgi:SsrA-binding protein
MAAKGAASSERKLRVVADNRKARFNYFIDETFEAGLALTGSKPNRYARARSQSPNPMPMLAGQSLQSCAEATTQAAAASPPNQQARGGGREGMTLIPLKLYFNEKGRAEIELALARGTKLYDPSTRR